VGVEAVIEVESCREEGLHVLDPPGFGFDEGGPIFGLANILNIAFSTGEAIYYKSRITVCRGFQSKFEGFMVGH